MAYLKKWHAAVQRIPNKQVFLEKSKFQKQLAWHGDRIIQQNVLKAVNNSPILTKRNREMSGRLINDVLSNKFMAQNIHRLLPEQQESINKTSGIGSKSENHRLGTILEAAIAKVDKSGDNAAIEELASWMANMKACCCDEDNLDGQQDGK